MLILILVTGKQILIEFPITWLTEHFVWATVMQRSKKSTERLCSNCWLWSNQIRTFSDPGCIVLCIIGVSVMEQSNNLTAVL